MDAKKAMRRKLQPFAVLAAATILASAGCGSDKTVKVPSVGKVSGTDQVLKDPSANPELKAQALQQQQMAQQQAQALQQAQARRQPIGQKQGH